MYGTLYRRILLPLFDRVIKGRKTLAYWSDLERSQWLSVSELQQRQLSNLRQLLQHAAATSPYYRRLWQEQGLAPEQVESLDDFSRWPLLTREAIREHRGELVSTAPLRRFSKSTGGSSGVPLQFELNMESHERRTAAMWRGYGWAGGAPGSKQLHLWGSHLGTTTRRYRFKSALHARLERKTMFSCFDLTEERMQTLHRKLEQLRPEVVIAYVNPLYEFAKFLDESGLRPASPRSLIVGAEKLHSFQREMIERVFRAPVFETYGSREFMLIGAECPEHRGLHLTSEHLLVEILDEDGRPTVEGQEGNVVVTDLFNLALPFIRYVTGDRAIAGFTQCPCGRGLPLLHSVTGRQLDMIRLAGNRQLPGEFFPHLMKEFGGVRRFQVQQDSETHLTIRLVVSDAFRESDRALLIGEVMRQTGPDVEIKIEIVDDIPLTRAGKLQVVVRRELTTPNSLPTV